MMTSLEIAQILEGLLGAAPQVFALFQRASSGQPVTKDEVAAALTQYNLDHAILAADVADSPTPGV